MPSDDYASFSGGGALKLKGGKISKNKKKKKDKPSGLERSLSTGDAVDGKELEKSSSTKGTTDADKVEEEAPADDEPLEYKTDAQKRHEEYKKKKVRAISQARPVAHES